MPKKLTKPVLLPPDLLALLDIAVLERRPDGAFEMIGEAPSWLRQIYPGVPSSGTLWHPQEKFLFLEYFLEEAAEIWDNGRNSQISSDVWTEEDAHGKEWLLEAVALRIEDQCLLLIKFPASDFKTLRSVYQEAREQSLRHYELLKELDKREILLHCTVHDLSAPLAGIRASLWLLREDQMVQAEGEEFLGIGLEQVDKMQDLITDTLRTFSTRSKPLLQKNGDLESAPDVARSVKEVTDALGAMATLKEVSFRILSEGPADASWKVVGNLAKLERVLFNLLENALRHTQEGSQIAIRFRDEGAFIRVSIKDQGAGVPPELMDALFERGRQGKENTGSAGLGLYFCKITVEDWGGSIGCLPNLKDGACFWFRLPKAGKNDAPTIP